MTIRRRFFPAQAAQQLPGRTLELSAQLRPEGVPPTLAAPGPVAPGEGQVLTWLPTGGGSGDAATFNYEQEIAPDQWYFSDDETGAWASIESWWHGQPFATRLEYNWGIEDFESVPIAIAGPDFYCRKWRSPVMSWAASTLYAAVIGQAIGAIRWELAWDNGPISTSHASDATGWCRAWAHANLLTVRFDPPFDYDEWSDHNGRPFNFVAQAFDGPDPVGQVELTWDPGDVAPS